MRFTALPLYNLSCRPLRSSFTVFGIAIAVACFVALTGLSNGIERAWIGNIEARGTHLLAMQGGTIEILTTSLDADLGEQLARVDGIDAVAGELLNMTTLEAGRTTMASGWPFECHLWGTVRLVSGRLPRADDKNALILGQSASQALQKLPGDALAVQDHTLTVVGVFSANGVMANNSAIMPLSTMQAMMERQGKVTTFHIRVKGSGDRQSILAAQSRLQARFPELSFVPTSDVGENDVVLQVFRAVAWSASAIAIVIALVVVLNTLQMSVLERTREIGVLLAVGWQPARILSLFVLEGMLLAVFGGVCGLAMGVVGLHWVTSVPMVRGFIEYDMTAVLLAKALSATLVLGVLGSLFPAWRAARLNPVEALRSE